VILQSCTDIQRAVTGLTTETCPPSSDGNEVVKIKVEEDIRIQEGDEPVLFPAVKVEYEVNCVSVGPLLQHISSLSRIVYCLNNVHLPTLNNCSGEQKLGVWKTLISRFGLEVNAEETKCVFMLNQLNV
jgi:hypothetical protein